MGFERRIHHVLAPHGTAMASIAMVVTNACAPDPRVMRSAELLGQRGHSVTVHAFDRYQSAPMSEMINGVRIMRYHIGNFPYGAKLATLRGLRAFSKVVSSTLKSKPPECVYCHDADTLAIGLQVVKHTGCKLVYDMHDLQHAWALMDRPNSILRRSFASRLERLALQRARKADLVVTSSGAIENGTHPGFKEYLAGHGIESIVVENRPQDRERVQKKPEMNGEWTVAYLGRVREIESFELLTKAIELIPEKDRPNLKVAGDGIALETVHAHLLTEASRIGIHLSLKGGFKSENLDALIQDVDVMFAMYPPSRGNILDGALPVKMFDASAFGVPTIVNGNCLMGEIASKEGIGDAVNWGDAQRLANVLVELKGKVVTRATVGKSQQEAFVQAVERLI